MPPYRIISAPKYKYNRTHHPLLLSQKSGGWGNFSFLLFAFSLLLLHHLQIVPNFCKLFKKKCVPVCWHIDGLCWELWEGRCHKCSPISFHPAPAVAWSGDFSTKSFCCFHVLFKGLWYKSNLYIVMSYVFPVTDIGRSSDIGSYIGSLLQSRKVIWLISTLYSVSFSFVFFKIDISFVQL